MKFIDFGYPPMMLAKSVQSFLFEAQEEDVQRCQLLLVEFKYTVRPANEV